MRTALLLAIFVFVGTSGEICITRAMKRVGEVKRFTPRALLSVLGRAVRIGWFWIGLAQSALAFYAILLLLSWNPVSFVFPASALSYAVGTLGAKLVLGEKISRGRWAGVFLVCIGVSLVWAGETLGPSALPVIALVLRRLVLLLACVPLAYYLFSADSARRFFSAARSKRREESAGGEFAPPVSILKPVRGLDLHAYENFASFCQQEYPAYEVLFGVSDADDPAIPVIEKLIHDFPDRAIRLFIGAEQLGPSSKVCKLCRLAREARYDVLVATDSDLRVGSDYLRAIVAPLRDPQVGAVTCLYTGLADRQLGAELEAVGASADFAAGVLVAWRLEGGVRFAMGSTMATTRRHLAEIGGFEALVDQHADDYEFGRRIAARGYRVALSPYRVVTMCPAQTTRGYFEHQLRWQIGVRHVRPGGHLGMLFTQGLPWAVAAAAVAPSMAVAVSFLGAYLALRLLAGWTVGVWGLRDPLLRRKLWLLPLRDALVFPIWLASFVRNRIRWRGLEFTLRKGRLIPVGSSRSVGSGRG